MHIGKVIQEVLKRDGHSVQWFSIQICCTRTHVYKIFNRHSIDTEMLMRISKALNHDFFRDYSKEINPKEFDVSQ